MTDFGVTPEGFIEKTLEIILAEIEEAERLSFGPEFNTQADSVAGQINGTFADKVAELWKVNLAVYRARQPDSASGEALDNVAAITGALRLDALPSSVTLLVTLDASTTLAAGSIAAIGAAGFRWITQAAVTNPSGFPATVSVEAKSEDSAPIVGNAFSIDSISVPVAGWTANAAKNTVNSETFPLADGQTLLVEVDLAIPAQVITFLAAFFADITLATAAEIAAVIGAALTNGSAVDAGGQVRMTSDLNGTGSALRVTGGTASEALGFTRELARGLNPNTSAKVRSTSGAPFALTTGDTLTLIADRGIGQVITFTDADFSEFAIGTIQAVAASLLAVGVDTDTFILDDGVNPAVTFRFDDNGSVVVTDTNRAINHTGTESASAMKFAIFLAINAAPTLDITASLGVPLGQVDLVNDAVGTAGNVAIVETVVEGTFVVTGMAGGLDNSIGAASAVDVAKVINEQIIDAAAYAALGGVQIESLTAGINSFVEITGGLANAVLAFSEDEVVGTSGDAVLGRDVESDADFRLRREALLRGAAACTLEAIRAAVRAITDPDVLQAFVFENTTDFVDGFGRPPHSFEVVVVGGDDTEIGQVIFSVKPIGIETFKVVGVNGRTVAVLDSQGISHDINFSRADEIPHFIDITLVTDPVIFGGGNVDAGKTQVRQALKDLGDLLEIGEDVIIIQFACAALDVPGVIDVTLTEIEDVFPPTNTANIVIDDRDLASFSTADITVSV